MTVDVAGATVLDLPLAEADPAVHEAIPAELLRQELAALGAVSLILRCLTRSTRT